MHGGGKKELLIVDHHQDLVGGGEVVLLRLLPHFDRNKYNLTVACVLGGTLAERIESMGIRVIPLDVTPRVTSTNVIQETSNLNAARYVLSSWGEFLRIVKRIRRQIRRENVSLLYTNSLKSCVLSALAAMGTKAAVVHHMHDICDPKKFNLPMLLALKWAIRYGVQAVVSISKAVTDSLTGVGVDARKIHTIHNGIDLDNYPSLPAREAKKRLGLDPEAPVVGHVARLMRWKGQDFFLRAASRVKTDARFLVVGGLYWEDPDYEKELRRLAKDLGLQDRVMFLGHREDVPQVTRAMDVLAHTSTKPEPFGLAIIEAMASEKPVVAFDNGGIPEIIEAGRTGILTTPLDEKEFARALDELLSDPNRALEMGKAGRERVERLFTLKAQSEKIQECFEATLRQKG
ncbi:MAG: glycosyltransferase [Candidatus Lindowbacteria bacterium]|nr:glycosyltransferase [Candidatus Lindowbacteria bacterium]